MYVIYSQDAILKIFLLFPWWQEFLTMSDAGIKYYSIFEQKNYTLQSGWSIFFKK